MYKAPLADIDFVMNRMCGLPEILKLPQFSHIDPSMIPDVLAEAARFFEEKFAPLNAVGDQVGSVRNDDGTVTTPPGFKEAYQAYVEAGWGAMPFDAGFGGGGFPRAVTIAVQEIMNSSNMALTLAPMLTQGAIDALVLHGSEEQQMTYLPKMITGEWTGTMNLTEPDAGSDVGAVRTKAIKQADGTYLITGTKIYITYGAHDMADNIIHLVLARTPDAPAGTKGISCFIVPDRFVNEDGSLGAKNDVTCVSIEHKMGIHASPTCVLSYGDNGGAVGYLIGEENQGMTYMFTMMNQARLLVGMEGLGLGERAYQQALDWSIERKQGRAPGAPAGSPSPIVDHPDVKRMLATMKATNEAMRRLLYWNASFLDIAEHHPDAAEREKAEDMVALLTPLSKGWGTDMGVELTGMAVQIHGGMGYIEETGVSQYYRDARITTIYEGTNGIQAIDLVGRKLGLKSGAVVLGLIAEMRACDGTLARHSELAGVRDALSKALDTTERTTKWLLEHSKNPLDMLSGATPYLRMLSTTVGGYLMAKSGVMALLGNDLDSATREARVATSRFFCEQLLPIVHGLEPAVCGDSALVMSFDTKSLAV